MNRWDWDLIIARGVRVGSAALGAGIMVYQGFGDHPDHPWLYAAALGLMGVPGVSKAQEFFERFTSTGSEPMAMPGDDEDQDRQEGDDRQPVRRRSSPARRNSGAAKRDARHERDDPRR